MRYASFVDEQIRILFDGLAGIPHEVLEPASYSFIDFYSSGICSRHYITHGSDVVVSSVRVYAIDKLHDSQKNILLNTCGAFYRLGTTSYAQLMEEVGRLPNLGELSDAVGFVAQRLGRHDYCPRVMQTLLEQNTPSAMAN